MLVDPPIKQELTSQQKHSKRLVIRKSAIRRPQTQKYYQVKGTLSYLTTTSKSKKHNLANPLLKVINYRGKIHK